MRLPFADNVEIAGEWPIDWDRVPERMRSPEGAKQLPAGIPLAVGEDGVYPLAVEPEEEGQVAAGFLTVPAEEGGGPYPVTGGGDVYVPHLPWGITLPQMRALGDSYRYHNALLPEE